jgi:hypothetical protein
MEWDRADLEARLCQALDISGKAVELFAENGYVDSELPENSFGADKVIAETAMLIYTTSAAGSPNVTRRLGEIAQLLLPHARSARMRLDMVLHPALCLDFAFPHVLLSELGYRDSAVDDLLKTCLMSRSRHGHERPPFATAEKLWVEQLLTGEQPDAAWRHCLRNTVLNRGIDILGGQRDDAYALTHLVMYCTDFGFRAGKFPRKPSLILDEAASLLAKCLDAEDYDLAGQVVLAWPLTATPWPAAAAFGFRVLARGEDAVGVLPGGTTRLDRLDRLQKNRYAFATAYHAAYVTGLLCAVSLRPRRAPPVQMIGPPFNARLLDRLIDRIECDQGHWQAEFMKLNRSEQDALGPFLLDIVIAQKCRKRDYAAVSELLVMADKYQSARSALCSQAAELLERLAAYARTTQPRLVASN